MLDIRPLSDAMGAEVLGVDLSLPLDKNQFDRILEAFHRHLLLVFPGIGDKFSSGRFRGDDRIDVCRN